MARISHDCHSKAFEGYCWWVWIELDCFSETFGSYTEQHGVWVMFHSPVPWLCLWHRLFEPLAKVQQWEMHSLINECVADRRWRAESSLQGAVIFLRESPWERRLGSEGHRHSYVIALLWGLPQQPGYEAPVISARELSRQLLWQLAGRFSQAVLGRKQESGDPPESSLFSRNRRLKDLEVLRHPAYIGN